MPSFLIGLLLLLQIPIPTFPVLPSPTPIPTNTPAPTLQMQIPEGDIYGYLSTAAANVNALPEELDAPGGVPLFPTLDTGNQIFSYTKWALSVGSSEVLGSNLSQYASHFFTLITVVVFIATVAVVIILIVFVIRVISRIWGFILDLIPGLG